MEAEATEGVGGAAVELVANDGMARFGQVSANLILAAGLEGHLEHGVLIARGDRAASRWDAPLPSLA